MSAAASAWRSVEVDPAGVMLSAPRANGSSAHEVRKNDFGAGTSPTGVGVTVGCRVFVGSGTGGLSGVQDARSIVRAPAPAPIKSVRREILINRKVTCVACRAAIAV